MTYTEYKEMYFALHNNAHHVTTSPLNEDDSYIKTYLFEDNAMLWELIRPIYETATAEVKGIQVNVDVKLAEIEIWTTESKSVKFYEKW